MKLSDKVALVTGAGQGLDKAIALAMAREGASLVICDINPGTLAEATKEIEALGHPCIGQWQSRPEATSRRRDGSGAGHRRLRRVPRSLAGERRI